MTDQFFWWYSDNEESFQGPCTSREEAIGTGFHEYSGEGTLYIVEATQATPGTNIFDFDRVLEEFEERNEECWGEDGEPLSGIEFKDKRSLETQLGAVLRNYLSKNNALRSWSFGKTRNAETINMETGAWLPSRYYQTAMIGSFRYALGRKSYTSMEAVNLILNEWDRLGATQDLIVREIQEAIDADKAGMEMDIEQWRRVLKWAKEKRSV